MTYYIVLEVGDNASTYGIFTTEQQAQLKIKEMYQNGFFGELSITEDEIIE